MGTAAVTMVKDEADIIASTVEHMLTQVDRVLVADNGSTDGTAEILDSLARMNTRLEVVHDPDPAYRQSAKMTALAADAHDRYRSTWIVPFDADEWWYSPFHPRLGDVLDEQAPQWLVLPATLYDHVATGIDPDTADPCARIRWRRPDPAPLPKVACRWRADLVIEQGNHGAWYDGGPTIRPDRLLVIRHFPYRSLEQFVSKVRNGSAAYRALGPDVPANVGTHWRQWGDMLDAHGEPALGDLFRKWYWRADPRRPITIEGERQPALIHDPIR